MRKPHVYSEFPGNIEVSLRITACVDLKRRGRLVCGTEDINQDLARP
jgi:hypothetical protein